MAKTAIERRKTGTRRAAEGEAAAEPASRLDPELRRRVIVEDVHPEVDAGRFYR